ncbi:MAG: hypothetical protein H0W88_02835 [Parachlamydiaceae bacterium]|nr:hypothetical protein [Parachlamydiaceae bacterium]
MTLLNFIPSIESLTANVKFYFSSEYIYYRSYKTKNLIYALSSSIFCYNYYKGHYSQAIYGKNYLNSLTNISPWVTLPLYVKTIQVIRSGEIFEKNRYAIVGTFFKAASYTIGYSARIYEFSVCYFKNINKNDVLYTKELKKCKNITQCVYLSTLSIEKIQHLYHHKESRTVLNVAKLIVTLSLNALLAACVLETKTFRTASEIVLNISTVTTFAIDHLSFLFKEKKPKQILTKV